MIPLSEYIEAHPEAEAAMMFADNLGSAVHIMLPDRNVFGRILNDPGKGRLAVVRLEDGSIVLERETKVRFGIVPECRTCGEKIEDGIYCCTICEKEGVGAANRLDILRQIKGKLLTDGKTTGTAVFIDRKFVHVKNYDGYHKIDRTRARIVDA